MYIMINTSSKYGSEQITFCGSYVMCHKMINKQILEFEESIESIKIYFEIYYVNSHSVINYNKTLMFILGTKIYINRLVLDDNQTTIKLFTILKRYNQTIRLLQQIFKPNVDEQIQG